MIPVDRFVIMSTCKFCGEKCYHFVDFVSCNLKNHTVTFAFTCSQCYQIAQDVGLECKVLFVTIEVSDWNNMTPEEDEPKTN